MSLAYLIAASLLTIASVAFITIGLSEPARRLTDATQGTRGATNALTGSPVGFLIRLLARFNQREALEDYAASTQRKLIEAGQPGGAVTAYEFLAVAELIGLGVAATLLLMMAGTIGLGPLSIFFALLLGGGAIWLAHAWLDNEVATRRLAISRQLPFFLDLGVMCIESGASFQETVEIYGRDNPEDALAVELRIALAETRFGKTAIEALESLIDRIDVNVLHTVMNAVIQAQRMGTPLGKTLREQAEVIRFRRTQEAERMGEELKVRMNGPVMLMMISVLLLIMGPVVLELIGSGIF